MSKPADTFKVRQATIPIYLPTFLFSMGEAAIIPVIPVIAARVGADLATAGFVAAMIMVGTLLGDIPSGWVISRIGERAAMLWSIVIALLGAGLSVIAPNSLVLGIGILLIGIATAAFALARHAFLTTFVPRSHRARALSTLGGTFRGGAVIGPLLTAGALALVNQPLIAMGIMAVCTLGAGAVLLLMPDPEATFGKARRTKDASGHRVTAGELEVERETQGLWASLKSYFPVLATLGASGAMVSAMRAGRAVLLPLWGLSIGMHESDVALIIGIAGFVDFALFYLSGVIIDKKGVLWSGVPLLTIMGTAFVVLSFTHNLPTNVLWFTICTFLLAIGNGVGAGILLTIGSNLADQNDPAKFLGAWRFTTDSGAAVTPVILSFVIAISSITIATGAIGVVGILSCFFLIKYVHKYLPKKLNRESPMQPSAIGPE